MEKHTLNATKRSVTGRKVKALRKLGKLPGNVFGKNLPSEAVEVNLKEFLAVFAKTGETGLVELMFEGKTLPVLIHNLQYHPVTRQPLHADFFKVNLKEKLVAHVPLVQEGEAPAVKDKVGVLLTTLTEVEVEALPADLPEHITIKIDALTEVDQTIKVKDLVVSDSVKIVTDPEQDVVKVAPLVSKEAQAQAAEDAQAAPAEGEAAEEVPTDEAEPQKEKGEAESKE